MLFQKKLMVLGFISIIATGCTTVKESLERNITLTQNGKVLFGESAENGNSINNNAPPTLPNMPQMSQAQINQFKKVLLLSEQQNTGGLRNSIKEASPTIFKALGAMSCYNKNDSPTYVNQFSFPNQYPFGQFSAPLSRSGKNKSQCMSVKSIESWETSTNNDTLIFNVTYIEDSTQNTAKAKYYMQKHPSTGAWLFTRSYFFA